jgi:S1-C subfamily serine protease
LQKVLISAIVVTTFLLGEGAGQAFASDGMTFLQMIEHDVQAMVERLDSSVVTIRAISRQPSGPGELGDDRPSGVLSTFVGSGIVLDTAGHILTTNLVVEGRDRFLVELNDGRIYEATLVGKNQGADVAILQTRAQGLAPAPWGDSDSLRPGSIIVVLGNSYGCPQSVSWGTMNGFRPDGMTIQMNVAVSAGNSGGAVLNSSGSVVGLVKAKVSEASRVPAMRIRGADRTASSWHLPEFNIELPTSGVALAVPINFALSAADRIIGGGDGDYPYLGVYVADLHSWLARYYHTDQGVVVGGVVENTTAAEYGLEQGDLIRAFNNIRVQTVRHFRDLVAQTRPGERVLLDVLRGGTTALKISLVMGRAGAPQDLDAASVSQLDDEPALLRRSNGVPGLLRPDDSMSINRLNEIRRRILESSDSLGAKQVDEKR